MNACPRADADGNVFVLRKNRDETAKSDILHLVADGDSYVSNSYPFPAATKELRPYRMEYSPLTSSGHVLMWLDNNGESVPALCVFNVFWGALQGFDSFIVVEPGSLNAEARIVENCTTPMATRPTHPARLSGRSSPASFFPPPTLPSPRTAASCCSSCPIRAATFCM